MDNLDIQPELPYPDESKSDKLNEENKSDCTEIKESVIEIQSALSNLEFGDSNNKNQPLLNVNKESISSQLVSQIGDTNEKTVGVSVENDGKKVLVPDLDREDAYLLHNILKEREGWESGSWIIFKKAEFRSRGRLTYNAVERLRKKYCIVDHKRAGKNYYKWNDRYVFNESDLKETTNQQTPKNTESEDWWNRGPIISLADADFRYEMDKELENDKRDKQQSTE
ncbi:MAG TPA: hypothetical protein PKL88_00930 [bacterium]|nr:hypothetical protein [Patescibacteria group bacterium]HNU76263.1 hypothetical protein [bacterium]HPD74045.1 hypothetical protein [bacterium]HRY57010.1 hypothetical protein [Patescibacteria group bacterium]